MNVNKVLTKKYEQMDTWSIGKNEPKTNPNEPKTNPIKANIMPKQSQTNPNKAKFKKAKMNVNKVLTKDYENKPPILPPKKQSQIPKRQKPIQTSLPQRIMKKSALSASDKTKPNKANLRLLKIALSSNRSLRYNEWVMKNILLRYKKHENTD